MWYNKQERMSVMSSRAKKKNRNATGEKALSVTPPVPAKKSKTKRIVCISALVTAGLLIFALLADLILAWSLVHTWITPEKNGWTQAPTEVGIWHETFELDTVNGKVYGWVMAAQQPVDEDAEEWLPPEEYSDKTVVFASNYDNTRELLDLGGVDYFVDFCKEGYNVVTFDWTGSGLSEGDQNAFLLDKTEELRTVVNYALEKTDADFLAVQGIGFGCYPAAQITAEMAEVDALILDSCYDRFSDVLFGRFDAWAGAWDLAPIRATAEWLFPLMTDADPDECSLSRWISRMQGKYIFFIQGESDELFGVQPAKDLAALAALNSANRVTSWLLPNVGHLRARTYDTETYFAKISAFLTQARTEPQT